MLNFINKYVLFFHYRVLQENRQIPELVNIGQKLKHLFHHSQSGISNLESIHIINVANLAIHEVFKFF